MKQKKIWLFLIILIGIFFRFNNLNWDQNFHLHPDERFLTMVGNGMHLPKSFNDYLSPKTSLFNPFNIGFKFFVYGTFPLILNKIIALVLNNDSYNAFTIQGRFLSAFFDLLTILLVYKTAQLLLTSLSLRKVKKSFKNIPLWSAFFYAIAVLPIQLAHFFAVDSFLNFFILASFYFSLKFSYTFKKYPKNKFRVWRYLILSSLFLGLALASKITALFILPLNLVFLLKGLYRKQLLSVKTIFKYLIIILGGYFLISYFVLRLADPYIFETRNLFDPSLNTVFVQNIKSLKSFEGKDVWYPPAIQWITKQPVVFSLINLAVFGLGLPYFILVLLGMWVVFYLSASLVRRKFSYLGFFIILFWVIGFFLYQSTQFVKAMRYFIFIYPFLAIFAGIGMEKTVCNLSLILKKVFPKKKKMVLIFLGLMMVVLFIWPLAFSSIYLNKNSRVEASEWIYENLPSRSFLLGEHWDDPLPLFVIKTYGKRFQGDLLPVFDPDTPQKFKKINQLLKKADYYILSSNRGWGSIPTVPQKYPEMSRFYKNLLAGRLGYKKIKEFHSYPSFKIGDWKIEIPDDWADESFTVYDHPKVMIFKNEKKKI